MTVVLSCLRLELRRRWRSLVSLMLLVAISAAVILTALAAARRGASVLDRLHDRTLPATVATLANTPGFDWGPIERLPEVAALSKFVVDYAWAVEGIDGSALGFPFVDDHMLNTVERPVIIDGRNLDPTRTDEVLVSRKFVKSYHKGVGDSVVIELPSPKQLANSFTGSTPAHFDGPRIKARIVGVALSLWLSDTPDSKGALQVSPAVVQRYPLETVGDPRSPDNTQFVNALVRLKHGEADIVAFDRDLKAATGRSDIDLLSFPDEQRSIQHHISFVSRCLIAFAIAAFVAALFLVGQAVARYAAASAQELQTLRALGMTPQQVMATSASAPSIVALLGAGIGAFSAWLASARFPYGLAYYLEPSPGRQWDGWVTTFGVVGIVVLVAVGAAAAARLATTASARNAAARRSVVATAVGRSGAGVPLIVGARFALEAGKGRTSVPVRPALIGAVMGVIGIVAAFTFSHGVTDAANHPERFGQTFQLGAFLGINNQDFGPGAKIVDILTKQSAVAGLDDSRTAVASDPSGKATVSLWEYERGTKPLHIVVLNGRAPVEPDEVILAPTTLKTLHTHVGGTVTLVGNKPKANPARQQFRVVGSGLVPEGPHNGYADGGWITSQGYDTLFASFKYHLILLSIKHGLDIDKTATALEATLNTALPELHDGADIERGEVPSEVAAIREVRTLPVALGAFLGVLAIGAVGHALATAVRRRSHDLAVLRALGMTQWQCRWVVVTQATVLAVVGLVFGVPVGLAIGRTVWRVVADYTPIQYVPPLQVTVLLLIAPAALLVANLLAAWPGRRAARLRVAAILRAE
jgi:ABC-type lipoprotein release transport system permease subunit